MPSPGTTRSGTKLKTAPIYKVLFQCFYQHIKRATWYLARRNTGMEFLWWPTGVSPEDTAKARVYEHRECLLTYLQAMGDDQGLSASLLMLQQCLQNPPQEVSIDTDSIKLAPVEPKNSRPNASADRAIRDCALRWTPELCYRQGIC